MPNSSPVRHALRDLVTFYFQLSPRISQVVNRERERGRKSECLIIITLYARETSFHWNVTSHIFYHSPTFVQFLRIWNWRKCEAQVLLIFNSCFFLRGRIRERERETTILLHSSHFSLTNMSNTFTFLVDFYSRYRRVSKILRTQLNIITPLWIATNVFSDSGNIFNELNCSFFCIKRDMWGAKIRG